METIQGKAHNIHQHAKLITRDNNLESAYKVVMTLDGRPVRLDADDAVIINEGDTVIVAGNNRRGAFNAFAYRNLTNGTIGGASRLKSLFAAVLVTAIGAPLVGSFAVDVYAEQKAIAFAIAAAAVGLVGYLWYEAIQSVRAHAAVK